jgi:hypothetical protein
MKKNYFWVIIVFLFIILDYLTYLIKIKLNLHTSIFGIDYVIKVLLLFILTQQYFYSNFYNFKSSILKIIIFLILPLILIMHISHRIISIEKYYYYAKNLPKQNTGDIWKFDPQLSHRAIPNARGAYLYYLGDSISGSVPVYTDSLGFRNVAPQNRILSDTVNLFLGCSFTFGDYMEAESTFPYLISKSLNHAYINAGGSGYGFAQMYQLAHELIPENKFKYVFIQASPWLSYRAMGINGQTFYGYKPYPYFSEDQDSFILQPLAYSSYQDSKRNWRNTPYSYTERIRAIMSDGIRLQGSDYYKSHFASLKAALGIIPRPTKNRKGLELYFYRKIIDLCKNHGATPVIYKFMYQEEQGDALIDYCSHFSQVVNVDLRLSKVKNDTPFDVIYGIYHKFPNGDSIFIDGHPNKMAHKIIADEIINVLK